MNRRFAGILVGLIVIIIGMFIVTQHSSNSGSGGSTPTSNNQKQATNHVMGQGKKGVTLVEYGDYQCPICGIYYQPLKQVTAQFQQDIYFQFRNLPLITIHPNAFDAGRAAEAAGAQNKYWEMHDKLYENQSDWAASQSPQALFNEYAAELGLNVDQFKQDYSSAKANDAIKADLAAFDKTGQQMAPPSLFLDGVYVPNGKVSDPKTGYPSADLLAQVINAELAKKAAKR